MELQEREIVEKLNARDKRAFEFVFLEFYPSLCYFANKYVCNSEVAQDIVQECFIWFYEKNNRFENLLAFKAFLYECVYHKAINYVKASRKHADIHEQMKLSLSETDEDYESNQIETEVFEEIFQAINELPEECGRIFKMTYIERKSTKEISAVLNIAESTIKTQRQRAKNILRRKLKHLYPILAIIFFN